MRGPLHALWNTRLIGTYLKFRVSVILAILLAMAGGIVFLGIDGVTGMSALLGLVFLGFVALGFLVAIR